MSDNTGRPPHEPTNENRLKVKHKDTKNIESQVDNFFFPYALNQNNAIAKNSMIDALGKLWKNKTSSTVVEDMMRYIPSYFVVIGGERVILFLVLYEGDGLFLYLVIIWGE